MTEDEQHSAVKGMVLKHFRRFDSHLDDLYQEGRYQLIRYLNRDSASVKDDYFKANVARFLKMKLWIYVKRNVFYAQYITQSDIWQIIKMEEYEHHVDEFERIDPLDFYTESEYHKILAQELLNCLPEKERKLLEFYYFEDLEVKTIAKRTGMTQGAITMILERAKEAMVRFEKTGQVKTEKNKRVKDTKTGFIFDSVSSAAKFYNLRPPTLSKYLRGDLTNKTSLVYM